MPEQLVTSFNDRNLGETSNHRLNNCRLPSFGTLCDQVVEYHGGDRSVLDFPHLTVEELRSQARFTRLRLERDQLSLLDSYSFIGDTTLDKPRSPDRMDMLLTLGELDRLLESFNDFTPILIEIKEIVDSAPDLETIKSRVENCLLKYTTTSIESRRVDSAKMREYFKKILEFKQPPMPLGETREAISQVTQYHSGTSRNTTTSPNLDEFSGRSNSFTTETSESHDSSSASPSPSASKPLRPPTQVRVLKSPTGSVSECQQCGTADTPEWRKGPSGPRTLCNACGLFYGKLVKKFGKFDANRIMEQRKPDGLNIDRRVPATVEGAIP